MHSMYKLKLSSKPHLLSSNTILSSSSSSLVPCFFHSLKLSKDLLLFGYRTSCKDIDLRRLNVELLSQLAHRPFFRVFLSQCYDFLDDLWCQIVFFLVSVNNWHVRELLSGICFEFISQNSQTGVILRNECPRSVLQTRSRGWRIVYEALGCLWFYVEGGSDRVVQVGRPAFVGQVFDGIVANRRFPHVWCVVEKCCRLALMKIFGRAKIVCMKSLGKEKKKTLA